jgi:hypothetical protein
VVVMVAAAPMTAATMVLVGGVLTEHVFRLRCSQERWREGGGGGGGVRKDQLIIMLTLPEVLSTIQFIPVEAASCECWSTTCKTCVSDDSFANTQQTNKQTNKQTHKRTAWHSTTFRAGQNCSGDSARNNHFD